VANGVHEAEEREVRLQLRGEAVGAPMSGDLTRLKTAYAAIFRAILREQPASCTVVADRRLSEESGRTSAVVVVAEETAVQRAYAAPPGPFDEKRGGLGLALSIAVRVVVRHGGRVWSPALPDASAARRIVGIAVPLPERSR
jgi:hypothetical protein